MIGDDLTPFFVVGEFCHADDTLDGASVVGQFDAAYVRNGAGMGMADATPAYLLPSSSATSVAVDQILVHEARSYRVAEIEPDGTGLTVLVLENV
jgi:hypothetical protein